MPPVEWLTPSAALGLLRNVREARAELAARPLTFGDTIQIACADFIGVYNEASVVIANTDFEFDCFHCHGLGGWECDCDCGKASHWHDCGRCKATGKQSWSVAMVEALPLDKLRKLCDDVRKEAALAAA